MNYPQGLEQNVFILWTGFIGFLVGRGYWAPHPFFVSVGLTPHYSKTKMPAKVKLGQKRVTLYYTPPPAGHAVLVFILYPPQIIMTLPFDFWLTPILPKKNFSLIAMFWSNLLYQESAPQAKISLKSILLKIDAFWRNYIRNWAFIFHCNTW